MWKNSLFNPSQPPEMSEGYIPTAVGEGGTMPAWPMRVACEPLSRDFGFRVESGELEKVGGCPRFGKRVSRFGGGFLEEWARDLAKPDAPSSWLSGGTLLYTVLWISDSLGRPCEEIGLFRFSCEVIFWQAQIWVEQDPIRRRSGLKP